MLLCEVGEMFSFHWHCGEGSLMKCVCEGNFEVSLFLLNLMYNELFWKGRLSDWCSVIFSFCCVLLAFLCSSSPLSLRLSSDKTVKIWLSKVWRKRWHLKWLWFLCQSSCCNFSHWSVTCSLLAIRCDTEITVSKAIKVFLFFIVFVTVQNDKAAVEYIFKGKKNNLPFRFFTANLKVPFRCDPTWTK